MRSITAFDLGKLSCISYRKTIGNKIRLKTMLSSTSSTSNGNELDKKNAILDSIVNVKDKPSAFTYKHYPMIIVVENGMDLKLIAKSGGRKSFIWDPRITKYSVTIDEYDYDSKYPYIGFAERGKVDVSKVNAKHSNCRKFG
jgi:hypothetical protein